MPGRDGYSLIDAIRKLPTPNLRAVRAIAITAYAGHPHRMRAIAAGYDDYLTKPIDASRLTKTVADLIARRAVS